MRLEAAPAAAALMAALLLVINVLIICVLTQQHVDRRLVRNDGGIQSEISTRAGVEGLVSLRSQLSSASVVAASSRSAVNGKREGQPAAEPLARPGTDRVDQVVLGVPLPAAVVVVPAAVGAGGVQSLQPLAQLFPATLQRAVMGEARCRAGHA